MSYNYEEQKPKLFTPDGMKVILSLKAKIDDLLSRSGVVTFEHASRGITGDSWLTLAAFDYLIEGADYYEIPNTVSSWAQHRIICRYMGR